MNTYKLSITIILFLFISINRFLFSQERNLYESNSGFDDIAVDIAVSPQGNVYVTGYTLGYTLNDIYWRMMTIKYNSVGQELWRNYYDGEIGIGAQSTALEIDQFENVYVIGYSLDTLTAKNIATIMYDSSGQIKWISIYNGDDSGHDDAVALCVDRLGFVYVAGRSYSHFSTYDYVTIKYNSSGYIEWISEYNGTGNNDDFVKSIAVDFEQNVFITGGSYDSVNSYDYVTIKYDKFGAQEWVSRYNSTFNGGDLAQSLTLDYSGNVYVTGYSYNGTSNHHDFCTVKYDQQGIEQFVERYSRGNNSSSQVEKIIIDELSNLYVIGWNSLSGPDWDIITLKYNSSGNLLWTYIFDNGYKDNPTDIAIDQSGNIYITGYSKDWSGKGDYTTIKLKTTGGLDWVKFYSGPVNGWDSATAIALDSLGYIYITGYSSGIDGEEYATIKYDSLGNTIWIQRSGGITYIENEDNLKVSSFSLYQNYPNPFNPSTKIKFEIPLSPPLLKGESEAGGFVTLKVYDVLGNEIATLVNEELSAGEYEVEFSPESSIKHPASGIYFYTLRAGDFVQTKKMVLMK